MACPRNVRAEPVHRKLIARFGKERVTALGLVIIGLSGAVALSGMDILHFYLSQVLLGLGWNFGFIGATAMVADAHSESERSKAQGLNDFVVFGTVASTSFFSGRSCRLRDGRSST